ncbi:ABC transporter permease [Pseudothermotoga thermarum]|uniref:Binding-protein-dependent transport systems inner membrane component n=1 Tax=Pseudothermotoga thermarum DSM 5069 TaxID=688269 RepID=F7YTG4_9THEM|nr:ABC transporter permease subunit [Pseudothermotoga thermarum]AEH51178.1 binding-protein-dependent transport systems inner membrane component [Pseudothermotoga thermarum DSM 5069]
MKHKRFREAFFGFLLILPSLTILAFLYFYPLVTSIWTSFIANNKISLLNYKKVVELYLRDVIYSVGITVATVLIVSMLSIAIAGYLRFRQWKFLDIMYRLPLFIPFLIVGHAMRIFLAPHGTLNNFLTRLIGVKELPGLSRSWIGLLWAFIWVMTPYAAIVVVGAFRALDNSYIEAAQSLGASKLKVLFTIIIPMCRSSIVVTMILTFVRTISSLTIPALVGPNSPAMITIDMMFRINFFNDWGVANALGVVSYLIVVILAVYYLKFMSAERGGIKG